MKKNRTTHRIAKLYMMLFTILFVVLFGRFFYIQATGQIEGVNLEKWAEKKRTSSYPIDAERGKIVDRNGMTLAYDRPTYNMYAIIDPAYSKDSEETLHVKNKEKTAEQLATIIDMDKQAILNRLNKEKNEEGNPIFQVEFGDAGQQLSQDKKEEIEALELAGIKFDQKAKRYYPNGTFASHVLGFAQNKENSNSITGIMGIEKQMDKYLQEKNGSIAYQRDKYGEKLLGPESVINEPKDGANVQLTIDQKIQTLLEDAMAQVEEEYNPEQMMAAVMDPKTGEVLALGNRPSFNPNERSSIENWYNNVVSNPIEPGSTMKIFTTAAAMDAGVYDGDKSFKSGSYQVTEDYKAINDHNNGEGWGSISFDEGIIRSSNVAAMKLLWEELGPDRFLEYYQDFHLDQETGIDLPGENSGKMVYDKPVEKVTTSFGQGSTVTAIQMLKAATAVANDGKMMQPYVISQIMNQADGKVLEEKEPNVVGEPIDASTAKQVRELLGKVITDENGTGHDYELEGYSVAGKTGTAQIPNPNGGGYMTGKDNYIFSFLGMAPKEDPELVMYVSVKQPNLKPTEKGSEPVAKVFNTVMENGLRYMNIQPDQEKEQIEVNAEQMDNHVGASVSKAKKALKDKGAEPIVLGEGDSVQNMIPQAGTEILQNEKVFLLTSDTVTMPDMRGWSLRDALKFSSVLDLNMEQVGNGYVYKQSISPGSKVKKGGYVVVELKTPNETPAEATEQAEQNERSMQQSDTSDNKNEQDTE
ncbi:penicillin-binding protein [Pontibacillus salicampi]|uniref:serine-type D-Ala-D-Ala carboxypeptidase n=1 Tax=Pontibacillus salicampi TaxID=1449801 RepID=A0ABV6LP23_9BACI